MNKCGWCGKVLWPWQAKERLIFGSYIHEPCAVDRRSKLSAMATIWDSPNGQRTEA